MTLVSAFLAPAQSLGSLDPRDVATLVAAAADIALVLDEDGLVLDLAVHRSELASELEGASLWRGRPWAETLTVESRPKAATLLKEARVGEASPWRQLNHPVARAADVPILYCAVGLGDGGRVAVLGRDLRPLANLQQRLVEAQLSMERDYARLRQVEMRYRLLFEMSAEPVLVVDAATSRIAEANPAARRVFGEAGRRLVGRPFTEGFDSETRQSVQTLLAGVRASGRSDETRARVVDPSEEGGGRDMLVNASLFRQDNASLFLIRLIALDGDIEIAGETRLKGRLLKFVETAPDAMVVTDGEGRIVTTNSAFLELVHLATEKQARAEPLERWLGRPGVDVDVLMANLRQYGSVKLFSTTVRAEYGSSTDVEVSAVALTTGGQQNFGFSIRNVGRRLAAEPTAVQGLPRSVDQLAEYVGRVSIKDLVREATDVIERLYIEAALEMTNDNRASAAEMLGLSRQSLYVKLRRYGIADTSADPDGRD